MNGHNFTFHVGLHKTGTTFLQGYVFPQLEDVVYMRWRSLEYFLRTDPKRNYLVSSEGLSGRTFAGLDERVEGLRRLGSMFEGAGAVLGVRRHGAFLASLYSQYIRYGGKSDFEGFLVGARDDEAMPFHRGQVSFQAIVEGLEQAFGAPPLVYDATAMFKNPEQFLADICSFSSCSPGNAGSAFGERPRNKGLRAFQGDLLRRINSATHAHLSLDGRARPYSRLARWRLDPPTILLRTFAWIPSGPLVPREARKALDDSFSDDWCWIQDYIRRRPWTTRPGLRNE